MPPSTFHKTFGPAAGQVVNRPVSAEAPLRLGPRNCGQSAAPRAAVIASSAVAARMRWMRAGMIFSCWRAARRQPPCEEATSMRRIVPCHERDGEYLSALTTFAGYYTNASKLGQGLNKKKPP